MVKKLINHVKKPIFCLKCPVWQFVYLCLNRSFKSNIYLPFYHQSRWLPCSFAIALSGVAAVSSIDSSCKKHRAFEMTDLEYIYINNFESTCSFLKHTCLLYVSRFPVYDQQGRISPGGYRAMSGPDRIGQSGFNYQLFTMHVLYFRVT